MPTETCHTCRLKSPDVSLNCCQVSVCVVNSFLRLLILNVLQFVVLCHVHSQSSPDEGLTVRAASFSYKLAVLKFSTLAVAVCIQTNYSHSLTHTEIPFETFSSEFLCSVFLSCVFDSRVSCQLINFPPVAIVYSRFYPCPGSRIVCMERKK
jgi:hypothetical protein